MPQLVTDYGYLAVFVGTLLEGESILLLAAYAAHRGYLSLPAVVGVAFCGATLGDQIFFFSGRFFGHGLMQRLPLIRARAEKINALLLRYHAGLIVGIRFAYGLRIAGPVVIGMSEREPTPLSRVQRSRRHDLGAADRRHRLSVRSRARMAVR